jgi:ferredoxin-like protein FixX
MYSCLANFSTFRDISTKRCVRICPISQNFFADVVNRQCVSICPIYFGQPITYADPSTRFCVSFCPSVPELYAANVTINSTIHRLCLAVCPAGTWSDNNTRSCLPLCVTSP